MRWKTRTLLNRKKWKIVISSMSKGISFGIHAGYDRHGYWQYQRVTIDLLVIGISIMRWEILK